MIKKNFILFLTGIFVFIFSCREDELKRILTVKNNSPDPICFIVSHNFPDTALDCKVTAISLAPKADTQLYLRMGWEYELECIGILQIFIIDQEVWNSETCDNIKKTYKILKRFHLSNDVLRSSDWTVSYP